MKPIFVPDLIPASVDTYALVQAMRSRHKGNKMPLYEYQCEACEHRWEVEQSIKSPPESTCPKCLRKTAKRVIAKTNFALKGQGWARDGYR